MSFSIRVPSLITSIHCITQTEEPNLECNFFVFKLRCLRRMTSRTCSNSRGDCASSVISKCGKIHLKGILDHPLR
uniref:Similarity n=1 Tax=Microcystis aeruginosa (strain PCC 7806) TaxID=267872 RepID=A8YBW0_MICA7|nr:unnamed protein product [Microcystis aeruginosa PCC 7806]